MNIQELKKLTKKEREEFLKILDNPKEKIEHFAPAFGPFAWAFQKEINESCKKEEIIELKTILRMLNQGLDPDKDYQQYYKIKQEEEKKFK